MTPDFLLPTRRSFLGWTAALAGCALLTRPALAVPKKAVDLNAAMGLATLSDHVPFSTGTLGDDAWFIVFGRDEYGALAEQRFSARGWVLR